MTNWECTDEEERETLETTTWSGSTHSGVPVYLGLNFSQHERLHRLMVFTPISHPTFTVRTKKRQWTETSVTPNK